MSEHVTSWWFDERFLARPYGVRCVCGYFGCFPSQAEAEESLEHHKQRWAEAEAKLRAEIALASVEGKTAGVHHSSGNSANKEER